MQVHRNTRRSEAIKFIVHQSRSRVKNSNSSSPSLHLRPSLCAVPMRPAPDGMTREASFVLCGVNPRNSPIRSSPPLLHANGRLEGSLNFIFRKTLPNHLRGSRRICLVPFRVLGPAAPAGSLILGGLILVWGPDSASPRSLTIPLAQWNRRLRGCVALNDIVTGNALCLMSSESDRYHNVLGEGKEANDHETRGCEVSHHGVLLRPGSSDGNRTRKGRGQSLGHGEAVADD